MAGLFLGSVRSKAAKVKALMIVAILVAGTSFTVTTICYARHEPTGRAVWWRP